jgi:hypothetical protein
MLFAVFHFYVFSFPAGFGYSAFATSMCFMMHSMLFFWHRYELPAVALGRVTPEHPRQGSAVPSPVPSTTPSVQSDDHGRVPAAVLRPRGSVMRNASFGTAASADHMSRQGSSLGMIGGDDDGSYVYFMDGEVVVHRSGGTGHRSPSTVSQTTSSHEQPEILEASSRIGVGGSTRTGFVVSADVPLPEVNATTSNDDSEQADARNASYEEETSALQAIVDASTPLLGNRSGDTQYVSGKGVTSSISMPNLPNN